MSLDQSWTKHRSDNNEDAEGGFRLQTEASLVRLPNSIDLVVLPIGIEDSPMIPAKFSHAGKRRFSF